MKNFDPFGAQKEASFNGSLSQIASLGTYLSGLLATRKESLPEMRVEFEHLLLVSVISSHANHSLIAFLHFIDQNVNKYMYIPCMPIHTCIN